MENTSNEIKGAPQLHNIPTNDPFVVPDHFFDQFPPRVQSAIAAKTTKEQSNVLQWLVVHRWSLTGFAALAILFIVWGAWPATTKNMVALTVDAAVIEGVEVSDFIQEDLYEMLEASDNSMAVVDLPVVDEALLTYLENQNLSLDLLMDVQ